MKSSNPMFKDDIFSKSYALSERTMTVSGTMTKLMILTLIMMAGAGAVYYQFSLQHLDFVNSIMTFSLVVSVILAFILAFKNDWTPLLAPVYAFFQGALLSGISCFFESYAPGIVMQAISITFFVVFTMAILFKLGVIRATEKFRSTLVLATISICVFYLTSILLSFFGVQVPYFTSISLFSIGVNAVIAVIAALNLILDFDYIEKGVAAPLPSVYEWYGAFGLLVTILWLYLEILRILLRSRQR